MNIFALTRITPPPAMENYAWTTLVMADESYAQGAIVMAETLRDTGTKYPIVCAYAKISPATIKILEKVFDYAIEIPLLRRDTPKMKSRKQNQIYGSWISNSFTKWQVLNPEWFPWKKIILIDADMVFIENCDELFFLRAPAMTFSSPWVKPYSNYGYNPYTEISHGGTVSLRKVSRGLANSIVGLACMVLLEPSSKLYAEVKKTLFCRRLYGNSKCTSGFDEQLLCETLIRMKITPTHIHQKYNWITGKWNWLAPEDTPKVMQFYNGKPWKIKLDETTYEDIKDWQRYRGQVLEKYKLELDPEEKCGLKPSSCIK